LVGTTETGYKCWSQPIFVTINRNSIGDSWSGKDLVIDKEGNKILTNLIGAGRIEEDSEKIKRMSGVWLGQIGDVSDTDHINNITGLYGVQKGEERFSFTENGSAYIGTGSSNFISFNEDREKEGRSGAGELIIKTNKFNLDTEKLFIDDT
jgi:hypothetical protein